MTRTEEERFRHSFWCWLLEHAAQKLDLHADRTPGHHRQQSAALPVPGVGFDYVLRREDTAVELYLQREARAENEAIFDRLCGHQQALEAQIGHPLIWDRLPDRTGCRVRWRIHAGGWQDPGTWPAAIPATADAMVIFSGALTAPVLECARAVLSPERP